MFCTTRWDPILPESSRNGQITRMRQILSSELRPFFADLTRKSSGGWTNSGFFGISQHFRWLPKFSEMISYDQTRSESVFTGHHLSNNSDDPFTINTFFFTCYHTITQRYARAHYEHRTISRGRVCNLVVFNHSTFERTTCTASSRGRVICRIHTRSWRMVESNWTSDHRTGEKTPETSIDGGHLRTGVAFLT